MEQFEDFDFWAKVKFSQKHKSLVFFKTADGQKLLKQKYNEFKYVIPDPETLIIGEKVGEDKSYKKKKKSIKQFLSHE